MNSTWRHRTWLPAMAVGLALLMTCTACQDWAQFGGGPALTGNDAGETLIGPSNVTSLEQAYSVPLPGGSSVVGAPVVADAVIYAGTSDGHLVAASADAHTNCSGSPVVCQPLWTAAVGGATLTTAPVVANGVVYAAFVNIPAETGLLAAFDAAGTTDCAGSPKTCQPLWTTPVASPTSGPNVGDGTVFVDDVTTRSVLAFDAAGVRNCSGSPKVCQPLWTMPTPSLYEPTISGGHVFVVHSYVSGGTTANTIDVYDEAGTTGCAGSPVLCQPLWQISLPAAANTSASISGGRGYVETNGLTAFPTDGVTGCSGTPLVCTSTWTAAPIPHTSQYQMAPAVADGRVWLAGGGLAAYDADAASCPGLPSSCLREAADPASGYSGEMPSPVVTNGLVVAGSQIFDAAGVTDCTLTPFPLCSPVMTLSVGSGASGAAVSLGTIILGGTDGSIHAYQVKP